jgi:hypothetical protein
MPRIVGPGSSRLLLSLLVVALLFAFTPLERALMSSVGGSFAQSPYTALAFASPSRAAAGFVVGQSVPIQVSNRSGHTETYHWSATEGHSLISLGERTVPNGQTASILVPSNGAVPGTLRIALAKTDIFLTVPLLKS